jgi:hypothetical protein
MLGEAGVRKADTCYAREVLGRQAHVRRGRCQEGGHILGEAGVRKADKG